MKKINKKLDLDGTGRHPKGDRAVRKLRDKLPAKFLREARGWVYRHLRYRFGGLLCDQARLAGVDEQTLSNLEWGEHESNAATESHVAEGLGYHAEEIRTLARRWSRKLRGRKARRA